MSPARDEGGAPLSDLDYQRLATFRYALRTFLRFSEEAAREHGLTPNQHQMLLAIRGWTGDTAPSISDLAERLQLRHHSTVELAQRAASGGLVTFVADPADGRRQLLELTPAGIYKLTELSVLHRDELRRFQRQLRDVLDVLD